MKIQTIIAALLFFPAFILHADETTIIVNNVNNNTRSIVEVPEASISHEVLTVSFSSSGIYSLTVSDSMGSPVYTSVLPAGGTDGVPAAAFPLLPAAGFPRKLLAEPGSFRNLRMFGCKSGLAPLRQSRA